MQALRVVERRRSDPDYGSTANDPRKPDSLVDGAIAVGGSRVGNDDAVGNRFDVAALGIEADMKQDASFLAYLR